MKTLFSLVLLFVTSIAFAQTKTETLKVSGECGTCKKKIETAAKKAGASYAIWDKETKELTIKYDSKKTTTNKIETAIAAAGYDTPDVKATEEAYKKLDDCCQYERSGSKD